MKFRIFESLGIELILVMKSTISVHPESDVYESLMLFLEPNGEVFVK